MDPRGRRASTAACARVDHLALTLAYADRDIAIGPIPCDLSRFRYDQLAEADITVRLTALDEGGCTLATAAAPLRITTALPEQPAPILAFPAFRACR